MPSSASTVSAACLLAVTLALTLHSAQAQAPPPVESCQLVPANIEQGPCSYFCGTPFSVGGSGFLASCLVPVNSIVNFTICDTGGGLHVTGTLGTQVFMKRLLEDDDDQGGCASIVYQQQDSGTDGNVITETQLQISVDDNNFFSDSEVQYTLLVNQHPYGAGGEKPGSVQTALAPAQARKLRGSGVGSSPASGTPQ